MSSTDFDVVIGGTKAKVVRTEDSGYRRRTLRREVEQQLLSQSETPAMVSRADQRQLYQTSWAGGATWWKPLLGAQEANSYFRSNHMDVWSEPGKVLPTNKFTDIDTDSELNYGNVVYDTDGFLYAVGADHTSNSVADVWRWDASTETFVAQGTQEAAVQVGGAPLDYIADGNDFYFLYRLSSSILNFATWNDSTNANSTLTSPSSSPSWGDSLLWHNGRIIAYAGGLLRLYDISGDSWSTIHDDGEGDDFMAGTSPPGDGRMAVSAPTGVHYIKNLNFNGQPKPVVYQVRRSEAGSWIGQPIAHLPLGTIALDTIEHLGQLVISSTPSYRGWAGDDDVPVDMYFLGEGGMGTLGRVLGERDMDETPSKFIASEGSLLYFGGEKRLWLYDGTRGGVHTVAEWPSTGFRRTMFTSLNASNEDVRYFMHVDGDSVTSVKMSPFDDPDTVTNFGDDETHYVLTSNYFDGGLPMETKELTKVQIQHQAIDASSNQEWTVQVSADGGSFSDALVNSDADSTYASADLSGTTGRRFQYRLIYQTKDTERIPLEGLLISFTTGEMITEWDLTLDGDELLNVDNEVQDEQAFYDSLVTLAGTSSITTLVDNMQEQDQLTDTGTTTNVRVQAVEINKTKPRESMIRVVLREAA